MGKLRDKYISEDPSLNFELNKSIQEIKSENNKEWNNSRSF